MSRSNPQMLKKKKPALKPWKGAPSKPSATLATKSKSKKKRIALPVLDTLSELEKNYPNAHCALNHKNAFELLVATVLSAQCTDERVNLVTPQLFKKYPNPEFLSQASLEELETLIYSTGFYKAKAKNLIAAAKQLVQEHGGVVPNNMKQLNALPGVGRKTANVVMGEIFGENDGVVVDTHVTRLSQRFMWTKAGSAEKIEARLSQIIPKALWVKTAHLLIAHGRSTCKARNPDCKNCFLVARCPQNLID